MRFRLTYEGPLLATQRDPVGTQPNRLASHKQTIRRAFHHQLRRLWQTNKFLAECEVNAASWPNITPLSSKESQYISLLNAVASDYHEFGYRFVPLVLERWALLCSLEILFLRRDIPGERHTGW
jgi:hypothetical protein